MRLSYRQIDFAPLLLYWPAAFIVSHIPIPPDLAAAPLTDKKLHFFGYLILVFMMWLAVSPDIKINWRKGISWCVLFGVIIYAVLDEWLQGFVHRTPDINDFCADMAGAFTALVLLTLFSFWPTAVVLTSACIFILTNFTWTNLPVTVPKMNVLFHLVSYGFLALIWVQYINSRWITTRNYHWLALASSVPVCVLLSTELFAVVVGRPFRPEDIFVSSVGITAVLAGIYKTAPLLYPKWEIN